MSSDSKNVPNPPQGLKAVLWRLPIWLYRLRLGKLLGRRALLLNHIGRVSGLPRQAVLEVIKYEEDTNTHYVASGFGEKANWFRNIIQSPEVSIQVAGKEITAQAKRLPIPEAKIIFREYHQRHPKALKGLSKMIGYPIGEDEEKTLSFFSNQIPVIAFRPKSV